MLAGGFEIFVFIFGYSISTTRGQKCLQIPGKSGGCLSMFGRFLKIRWWKYESTRWRKHSEFPGKWSLSLATHRFFLKLPTVLQTQAWRRMPKALGFRRKSVLCIQHAHLAADAGRPNRPWANCFSKGEVRKGFNFLGEVGGFFLCSFVVFNDVAKNNGNT